MPLHFFKFIPLLLCSFFIITNASAQNLIYKCSNQDEHTRFNVFKISATKFKLVGRHFSQIDNVINLDIKMNGNGYTAFPDESTGLYTRSLSFEQPVYLNEKKVNKFLIERESDSFSATAYLLNNDTGEVVLEVMCTTYYAIHN
jgi:hypothetical protein